MYSYTKEEGFNKIADTKIGNVIDVSYIEISRDGSKVAILLPEPTNALKILDYSNTPEGKIFKEIVSIPIELPDFKELKFNPMNKNFIFVMAKSQYQLIEIIDSFSEDYQMEDVTKEILSQSQNLEQFKQTEEEKIIKRYEIYTIHCDNSRSQFSCFSWDRYGRVYISEIYNSDSGDLNGEVRYIDPIKSLAAQREKGETLEINAENIEGISSAVTSMILTQRYLVCALANGCIDMINMHFAEKDLKEFRNTLGSSYKRLSVDKELKVSKLTAAEDYIVSMKYDLGYKKIMAKTVMNNIYILFLKGEILEKNIEENSDELPEDVDNYVEAEFHKGKILAVRELGKTTEIISISVEDSRVLFWDIGKRECVASHRLDFIPTVFEVNPEGTLLFIASQDGVFRIFDITRRTILRLLYQMKFDYNSSHHIDKILVHPLMKYIIFYQKGGRYLFFISGELSKKFVFLGFLKIPTKILDVCIQNVQGEDFTTEPTTLAGVLVLVRGMLLYYNIFKFFVDNKVCWELSDKKVDDVFANFELQGTIKAKKVDGDLTYILKNKTTKPMQNVWLTGTDKMFRIFPLPTEKLEVVKESKKPIETPEEFPAHDLLVQEAYIYQDEFMVSCGQDGYIRIYTKKVLSGKYRTHSFVNGGITSFQYNHKRRLIICSGYDGSVCIMGVGDNTILPASDTTLDLSTRIIETLESVEPLEDNLCQNFVNQVSDQHQSLIKKAKSQNQSELKAKFEEIKIDQAKLFSENSKLEKHEQLKESDMIIDLEKIDEEQKKNVEIANDLTKERFKELCEMELQKNVLYEKTYCKMIDKEDDRKVNNNIRLVFNSTGDRELQTYPLPNLTEDYKKKLYYVKQMRLLQKMEDYKRRNEQIKPLLNQDKITCKQETYILNRAAVKPIVTEQEVILAAEGVEKMSEADKAALLAEEKSRNSVVKYRLQRNPYEEINKKGGDDADQMIKGPEEQIYKDDLQMEYRTIIDYKDPPDLEFKPINEISSYLLLYSPFELYTNVRIRNQIILLLDVIHEYKKTFNAEYFIYIKERNQLLEKFNTNKSAIEAIKEILTDIPIQDYNYAMNPHEDNEWIDKFSEKDITIPHYYSKEEKEKMEQEKRAEEERLKALQGDTLQMRGLKHMIDNRVKKKKENENEQQLVREPWMNKRREEMTDEQAKIYLEFQKKEMELREQKEKIRSQNLTKLNFHKSEIENNQIDLDMKFAKILRKKLHYDSIICEQEIYILSLMSLLNKREAIKKEKEKCDIQLKDARDEEEKLKNQNELFEISAKRMREIYSGGEDKAGAGKEGPKMPINANDEFLQKIRNDPYYSYEKTRLENIRHYGDKDYKEVQINPEAKDQNKQLENKRINDFKYYCDYKKKQFDRHKNYINNKYLKLHQKAEDYNHLYDNTINLMEKLKLNFSLMVKMKRGQDEVTDDIFMEKEEKTEEPIIENEALDENMEGNEEEQQENIIPEEEEVINQEELNRQMEEQQMYELLKRTSGVPVENSMLIDRELINDLNKELQKYYKMKMESERTNKDHTQMKQYLTLENELLQVLTMDITLKMKYLKLTRVTKKIQEVVTGKEEINQAQIAKLYEDKKRNLEENTSKRIATLDKKYREINNDIKKKVEENHAFNIKLNYLKDDVVKTQQIIDLDEDVERSDEIGYGGEDHKPGGVPNKSLEIAEVSKLKSIVKNYYEEIEYLRAELDKLRARTFPSFLQKPDNVIYPDEK